MGDQCISGLNFETKRPRRDILVDYRHVLDRIYSPDAFFGRVENVAMMLRRPALDRSNNRDPPPKLMFGVPRRDLLMLWRIVWRLAVRQPHAVWPFLKVFRRCMATVPGALPSVGHVHRLLSPCWPFLALRHAVRSTGRSPKSMPGSGKRRSPTSRN